MAVEGSRIGGLEESEPTPASLKVKKAGADQPPAQRKDFRAKAFQLTVEDINKTQKDLNKAALSFDVKTYIQEMVDERTEPILKKSTQYLTTMYEVRDGLVNLQNEFKSTND